MGLKNFALHFTKVYFTALPRIANKLTLSVIVNPSKALSFVENVLHQDDLGTTCPILGSRTVHEIFPVRQDISIKGPYHQAAVGGTYRLSELVTLAAAAKFVRPKIIFEIGTNVGRTGRVLLLNLGDESKLFTLDLPVDQCSHIPGADLRNTPEGARTTFLSGDSMFFDYSQWYGKCGPRMGGCVP